MLLRATWVFPVSEAPIRDGVVVVRDGRIQAVGEAHTFSLEGRDDLVQLPADVVLVPGLVNAHTHLDLTRLAGRIAPHADPVSSFRELHKQRGSGWGWQWRRSVKKGLQGCIEAGTTSIGDVSSRHDSARVLAEAAIRSVVLLDATGLGEDRGTKAAAALWETMRATKWTRHMHLGVCARGAYCTGPGLFDSCRELARYFRCPLAVHLSSTREEVELFQTGTGPLRQMLEQTGRWDSSWSCPQTTPVGYLKQLGLLTHAQTLVHCNYLEEADVEAIRYSGSTVVYCPRVHARFGHEPYPLDRLLSAGVPVALGTGSLACGEGLSVLDEMRAVHDRHPHVAPEAILRMATLNGVQALELAHRLGTLQPGKWADLVGVRCPPGPNGNPHDRLLLPEAEVAFSLCDAQPVWDPGNLLPRTGW